jgi:SAM-dependent methyltransferase
MDPSPSSFDPSEYGRNIASDYDETTGAADPSAEVAAIVELSQGAPILEFGIGTGRLALPLVERGHRVAGIEGSAEMVRLLRQKPGGADIPVEVGDFSETRVEGEFGLVVLTMNTVYALPSQQAQVRCFSNAARHLSLGGSFVVEAWLPDLGAYRQGHAVRLVRQQTGEVVIETSEIFPATQTMQTNKVYLTDDSVKVFPANHRYAWPAELDLMAELAGLKLTDRWADWSKNPYTDNSTAHVSVWRKVRTASGSERQGS